MEMKWKAPTSPWLDRCKQYLQTAIQVPKMITWLWLGPFWHVNWTQAYTFGRRTVGSYQTEYEWLLWECLPGAAAAQHESYAQERAGLWEKHEVTGATRKKQPGIFLWGCQVILFDQESLKFARGPQIIKEGTKDIDFALPVTTD